MHRPFVWLLRTSCSLFSWSRVRKPPFWRFFLRLDCSPARPEIAFAILHGLLALERRSKPDEAPLAQSSAIGAFLLSFFVLIWIANLNSFSNFSREPIESLLTLLLLFLVSALVATGARALALRSAQTPETTLALLRGTTLATLTLMAVTLGVGLWQSQHTLVLGPFLLIAAALLYLTLRLGPVGLGRLPLLLLALFLASPVVPVVAWAPASPASSLASDGPVRRIVLLTVDTLRRDSLSLYNADSPSPTPALDRLGEDSLIFEKAFSSAPWTVPAFVSMFTGLTPDVHGINHNFPELPEDMKLLAQPLQEKGYLTAAIGNQIQLRRMDRGFDHFRIGPEKSPFHPRTTFGRLLGRRWSADQWTSQRISNLARRWLGENRNQDFFLWVHWIEPHISYAPPTEYLPDPSLSSSLGARFEGSLHSSVRAGRVIRSAKEKLWLRELYDAEVRYTDDIVGQVLERLRELDLYDDTLIVFTSDHGEEFWDHDNWEHGHSVYDELVAAPLLIKLPGERPQPTNHDTRLHGLPHPDPARSGGHCTGQEPTSKPFPPSPYGRATRRRPNPRRSTSPAWNTLNPRKPSSSTTTNTSLAPTASEKNSTTSNRTRKRPSLWQTADRPCWRAAARSWNHTGVEFAPPRRAVRPRTDRKAK